MLSRIFINKRKRGREVGMVGSMLGGGHRCRMVRRAVIKLRRSRIPTTHLHLFYWKTCLWGNPTFAAKMLALIQFLDLACGGYIWDWAVSAFELEQPFVRSWEMKWERERKITFGAVQRMFFSDLCHSLKGIRWFSLKQISLSLTLLQLMLQSHYKIFIHGKSLWFQTVTWLHAPCRLKSVETCNSN